MDELLDQATQEVCVSCRFDRALLFQLDQGELVVQSVHVRDRDRAARELRRTIQASRPALSRESFEAEVVRRRTTMLADAGQAGPTPLAELRGDHPLLAAPLVCEGHVVGLLEVDRAIGGHPLDESDREALSLFAHGLASAVEHVVLVARLRALRDHVRQLTLTADAVADELCDAEMTLSRADVATGFLGDMAATPLARTASVDDLLSTRELEVLEAMAAGATNAEIATRLYISEETVKTHVKHILRKLGAANRAQAVSRHLRLAAQAASRGRPR